MHTPPPPPNFAERDSRIVPAEEENYRGTVLLGEEEFPCHSSLWIHLI